jgi:hypothetical protein
MGITIHYRFRVRSKDAAKHVVRVAKELAVKLGMEIRREEELSLLVSPHPKSETISVAFRQWKDVQAVTEWDYCREALQDVSKALHEKDYVSADFTKTQFAGLAIHVRVAEFLRIVASMCSLAYVSDEADYYETRDTAKASENFSESTEMMKKLSKQLKEMYGEKNVYSAIDYAEGG